MKPARKPGSSNLTSSQASHFLDKNGGALCARGRTKPLRSYQISCAAGAQRTVTQRRVKSPQKETGA